MNTDPSANGFVKLERERRGLSVREAASAGGISNETWGRYEHTGHLTPKMRQAIGRAFHLTPDTTEGLLRGEPVPADGENLHAQVDELARQLADLVGKVEQLATEFRAALRIGVENQHEIRERLGRLEQPGEQAGGDQPSN